MNVGFKSVKSIAIATCLSAACALPTVSHAAITVAQTTSSADLGSILTGSGITVTSATIHNGAPEQFGTYTGFSNFGAGSGIVLSNGVATDTAKVGAFISTALGVSGTPEFDAYGVGHIYNFADSNDVAALQLNFHLESASAISFSFIFGSMEYPDYVDSFTDAFLAFLDGTGAANQIVFDANKSPVQVGSSFASSLVTTNTNTAFTDPHGLVGPLTTTTGVLSAGDHSILFEVGDTNDEDLDSAVFLSGLTTASGTGGGPVTAPTAVPEPATNALMSVGLLSLAAVGWRRQTGRREQRRR